MPDRDPGLRFRRLLAMVTWLASRERVKLSELAEQFGMDEDEVERELMLVSMCGLPPYSPVVRYPLLPQKTTPLWLSRTGAFGSGAGTGAADAVLPAPPLPPPMRGRSPSGSFAGIPSGRNGAWPIVITGAWLAGGSM